MGPSFKIIFAKFHTYRSHEQCMRPKEKTANMQSNANVLLSKPSLDTKMM